MSKPVLLGIGFTTLSSIIKRGVAAEYEYDDFESNLKSLQQRCADENIAALFVEYGADLSISAEHLTQIREAVPALPIVVGTYYTPTLEKIGALNCAALLINYTNRSWPEQLIEKIAEAKQLVTPKVV